MTSHPKLATLTDDGNFRAKVAKVIAQLENRGESPKIFETKRTVAQQREKVRLGYSKTMFSEHLKTGKDGLCKAADIADASKGWNASRRFWFIIGAACQSYGIGWGGLFGLKGSQKAKLAAAFDILREAGWPDEHDAYRTQIGWDPAHLQQRANW